MEEQLVQRLLGRTAITDITGNRINWITRPKEMPALTLQVISGNPSYTHQGRSNLEYPRVQFDCWATSYLAAKRLARAVIAEMELPRAHGGIAFEDAILDSASDMPMERLEGGTEVFRVTLDFMVPVRAVE